MRRASCHSSGILYFGGMSNWCEVSHATALSLNFGTEPNILISFTCISLHSTLWVYSIPGSPSDEDYFATSALFIIIYYLLNITESTLASANHFVSISQAQTDLNTVNGPTWLICQTKMTIPLSRAPCHTLQTWALSALEWYFIPVNVQIVLKYL